MIIIYFISFLWLSIYGKLSVNMEEIMKNEDKIYQQLLFLNNQNKTDNLGITTNELADSLVMKRNLVSHHLNLLVQAGKITKTDTRPVYYTPINTNTEVSMKPSAFDQLIGSKSSLRHVLEQCKSAVLYPNGGLPILITGNSGVGKSYLAKLIYEYAKENSIIEPNAPFVVFNCADYANNVELLSSKLFGHVKGAFTGAIQESLGVIDSADGGYLFLDEVHRLSPEGQEKLFLLLDKGMYQQMGDNKNYKYVKVRLVCATTESIKDVLIDTFVRRIPITVLLPDFNCREISEKIELINHFYLQESELFHQEIQVSKKIINYLLSIPLSGNIGELRNIIKVSCANGFRKINEGIVKIDIQDLVINPHEDVQVKEYFTDTYLKVSKQLSNADLVSTLEDKVVKSIGECLKNIHSDMHAFNYAFFLDPELEKSIKININKIADLLYFKQNQHEKSLYATLFASHLENGLRLLEKTYGLKYYGNTVHTLSNVLTYFEKQHSLIVNQISEFSEPMVKSLRTGLFKYNIIANKLLEYLNQSFGYVHTLSDEIFLTLYIYTFANKTGFKDINAVIVAHGFSTASSIASVVNQMFGSYIFEAFDMPIDMQPHDIIEEINRYAKHINKEKGTIFLVDMGSLFEIYPLIKNNFIGEVVVINNISTQLALGVGSMISQGKSIISIVDSVVKESEIKYKYYERKGKKKAIITTCASGIGSANKIRDILKNCIMSENEDFQIISCDYFSLKNLGKQNPIFNKYDVRLIITTLGLKIEGITTVLFSEFFSRENENQVRDVFSELFPDQFIDKIMNNLIKMLTLENVISRLIILNPNRVIEVVDCILVELEREFNIVLDNNLKLTLFIHIAIMIERHVLAKDDSDTNVDFYYENTDTKEIKVLHKVFDKNVSDFDIQLPDYELALVLRIIKEYRNT